MARRIAALFLITVCCSSCHASAEFRQLSCKVDKGLHLAIIWVDDYPASPHNFRFSVQFQRRGILFQLPPEFYAPSWDLIDEIEMIFSSRQARWGTLRVRVHDSPGDQYVQTVGSVDRPCWNSIKPYIRDRLLPAGSRVKLTEVN